MANLVSLYDHVIPFLPGAEPGIVDFQIRKALREFFKRTAIWRETFEFNTVANVSSYNLLPTAGIVAAVMQVHVNGQYAYAVPEDRRDPLISNGTPTGWYSLLPQLITLYPTPASILPVRVEAALTLPVDGSNDTYPDEVLDEHAESIAAGAVAAMMMMPGKPWTQRESGAAYARTFGSAIRDTRGKLRDGGQPNQSTFIGVRRFGA